jgi:hypothetical protein
MNRDKSGMLGWNADTFETIKSGVGILIEKAG